MIFDTRLTYFYRGQQLRYVKTYSYRGNVRRFVRANNAVIDIGPDQISQVTCPNDGAECIRHTA